MSETLPRLGVDLDDVIGGFSAGFPIGFRKIYGTDLGPRRKDSFNFDVAYGSPQSRGVPEGVTWLDVIHKHTIRHSLELEQPLEDAIAALGRLAVVYEIHIVTARPKQTREVTERWLDMYIPEGIIAKLHMPTAENSSPIHTDKGEYARKLGLVYLIDDRDENVVAVHRVGIGAISFGDYYYNYLKSDDERLSDPKTVRQPVPDGIHKAYNWREVEGILLPE